MLLSDSEYNRHEHDAMVRSIASQPELSITEIIEALVVGYDSLYTTDTMEINNGMCDDFANDLKIIIPRARVEWVDDIDQSVETTHAVAVIDGCFYDSETPNGTTSVWGIPLVVRERGIFEILASSPKK